MRKIQIIRKLPLSSKHKLNDIVIHFLFHYETEESSLIYVIIHAKRKVDFLKDPSIIFASNIC
jgi:hypothetical protein